MITLDVQFFTSETLHARYRKDFECICSRISYFCNNVNDDISLTGILRISKWENFEITFPNIVYIEALIIGGDLSIAKLFPNLKKISHFYSHGNILDMGNIDDIDKFSNLLFHMEDSKLLVEKISEGIYLFVGDNYTKKINIDCVTY